VVMMGDEQASAIFLQGVANDSMAEVALLRQQALSLDTTPCSLHCGVDSVLDVGKVMP
jgi:hypothetical protein